MENDSFLFVLKPATYIEKRKMPVFLFSDLRVRIGNRMNRRYMDPFPLLLDFKIILISCPHG